MKFVIITRVGIGRRDGAFYREHLRLCELTIAPSLRAQTDRDFLWVLAIDKRAPRWVESRIKRMTNGIHVEIWRRDPLIKGNHRPVWPERLIELAGGEDIITARVDDDDMLRRDYVARTKAALQSQSAPAFLTYTDGYGMAQDGTFEILVPWHSVGLAALAGPALEVHAHAYPHHDTGLRAAADGHTVIEIRDERMWIRTFRPTSDSALYGKQGIEDRGASARIDGRLFGLTWLRRLAFLMALRVERDDPDLRPVTLKHRLGRLNMKSSILNQIHALQASGGKRTTIEALTIAYYKL